MKNRLFIVSAVILLASASFSAQSSKYVKLDEFGSLNCEEYLARMDSVIISIRNVPSSRTVVVVYEGKTKSYKHTKSGKSTVVTSLPTSGLAKVRILSMKKYLGVRGVSPNEVVFVNGGFREDFTVEFFSVPEGAADPEPSPTLKKMKYGKGKPEGFCVGCC